jgi:hypothetical protein
LIFVDVAAASVGCDFVAATTICPQKLTLSEAVKDLRTAPARFLPTFIDAAR